MTELFTSQPVEALKQALAQLEPCSAFALTDENVFAKVIRPNPELHDFLSPRLYVMPAGEEAKTLEQTAKVWDWLSENGATRKSVLVNIGGGVVTDLGGFTAATYMRGIPHINVPTSLLGAVDAAFGGKTGIDFGGLKNLVGAFRQPTAVIVCADFFATLPREELLSGYGEMLKHALLDGPDLLRDTLDAADDIRLGKVDPDLLRRNIAVKSRIVSQDPEEGGLRRVLNLGHTVGHAIEEWRLAGQRPVPHGYAVAWGLTAELALSVVYHGLKSDVLRAVGKTVSRLYGSPGLTCDDYPALLALMQRDKKNPTAADISFAPLPAPGTPALHAVHTPAEISAAIDLARDLLD